jgi:hypothetical protein
LIDGVDVDQSGFLQEPVDLLVGSTITLFALHVVRDLKSLVLCFWQAQFECPA